MATKFVELFEETLDTNNINARQVVDIADITNLCWVVEPSSGAHTTWVLELECSHDGTNWFPLAVTLNASGTIQMSPNTTLLTKWAGIKVKTIEGGTSTVKVTIQGK